MPRPPRALVALATVYMDAHTGVIYTSKHCGLSNAEAAQKLMEAADLYWKEADNNDYIARQCRGIDPCG